MSSSSFFNREMHRSFPYDTKYKIKSDYNSIVKMSLKNLDFTELKWCIVDYDTNGISATRYDIGYIARIKVQKENGLYEKSMKNYFLFIVTILKNSIGVKLSPQVRKRIKQFIQELLKSC